MVPTLAPEIGRALDLPALLDKKSQTTLLHELRCYADYVSGDAIAFWRSASGFEVDFLLGDHTAIELKAKKNVGDADLRSLRALAEERVFRRHVCVSLESRPRRVGAIEILPWGEFLDRLWRGEYSGR